MKYYFALLISGLAYVSSGQDLLVDTKNDSLNVNIEKQEEGRVYFSFERNGAISKSYTDTSNINTIVYDYYVPIKKTKPNKNFPNTRFEVTIGLGFRTAELAESIPNEFEEHYKKLKSGMSLAIGFDKFINNNWGLGIRYNSFRSKNESTINPPFFGISRISEKVNINYIAPRFTSRSIDKFDNIWNYSFSIGWLGLSNEADLAIPIDHKGSTVGLGLDLGYDIEIGASKYLGLNVSMTIGTLSKIEQTIAGNSEIIELSDNERENISWMDFGIGLRF